MNNNYINNQKNITNSSMNYSTDNLNRNFNNQQLNNNSYSNNLNENNNSSQNNKLNNKKHNILIIIIGIILVLIIIKIFSNLFMNGSHQNNTGSSEYSSKDVDLNCIYTLNDDNKNVTVYSDFIFNYKSTGKESYNYLLKIYNKKINVYPNGLTDEIYNDFINNSVSSYCGGFTGNDCKSSHLELGITDFGWDTVIDRTENTIILTYSNIYGIGQTATKEDIKEMKKAYEAAEYKCN